MMLTDPNQFELRFDGSDVIPDRDNIRLETQLGRILELMRDGEWRTLERISALTGSPEASVSAQLRNLRKPRFGGWTIDRMHVENGLYQYRISK